MIGEYYNIVKSPVVGTSYILSDIKARIIKVLDDCDHRPTEQSPVEGKSHQTTQTGILRFKEKYIIACNQKKAYTKTFF